MTQQLYIEVDKVHAGIMGLTDRVFESGRYAYVPVTQAEVDFINRLEDVFPSGTIATLDDLKVYRAGQQKVANAKQAHVAAQVELAKAMVATTKARAELYSFMTNAAAERGLTVAELKSLLEARQKRITDASHASNTNQSPDDDKARQSLISQLKTRSKSKSLKEKRA
ncbi:hypothetical protein [Pseudomonas sp. Y24-6]|uniref:hypothetical protein n=1 Tax=Pseudomonas sp. Y24-6 TaxID=2750013 RepID=UPI001CE09B7E|nr:hypothetical protein [Pseudomonas sp. Y24-6]MCA4961919.1 hypothetical protein [Pseudomonas sp. Y24-6]